MVKLQVKKLRTLKDKSLGLIGQKKAYPIMLETRFGIHTLGLNFSIDVLILDTQKRVVVLKESLSPFRIFLWNPRFKIVLEMPIGTIKKYNIKRGTEILLR
ncbi:MAG: DUF192 domain-containing protein [Patescibacteria group bacterium]